MRPELELISEWIRPGARVLDLGCGDGALLAYLREHRQVGGYGLEIDQANVLQCIQAGVSVIHADLEAGLADFGDSSFDYVIMTQTLQAVRQTEALLGAYYNDERAAKMRYSDTIAKTDMLFFTLKGSPIVYRGIEDLRPYTVGTIIAADYPAEFNAAQFIRKEPVPDHVTNIRKLLGGRIDLFVEKKYVVLNTLRTQFPADAERIEALPVPLRENRYFNAFSRAFPENERITADFNKGLALIIADGTYEAIMERGLHE